MLRTRSPKSIVGISLIVLMVLSAISVPIWLLRWANVDFPCQWFGNPPSPESIAPTSRLAYCISVYPRNAHGGYPLYGSSPSDAITLNEFGSMMLRRQQTAVLVNNHRLEAGETFHQRITGVTANPWLLAVTDLTITNQGLIGGDQNSANETVFISGEATESWAATPIPFAFLALGIALILLDVRERNARTRVSTAS